MWAFAPRSGFKTGDRVFNARAPNLTSQKNGVYKKGHPSRDSYFLLEEVYQVLEEHKHRATLHGVYVWPKRRVVARDHQYDHVQCACRYTAVGAPCNVCPLEEWAPGLTYGDLVRMNPDGTNVTQYASGIRNSVGLDWDPATGKFWMVNIGRDLLVSTLLPNSSTLHAQFMCRGRAIDKDALRLELELHPP